MCLGGGLKRSGNATGASPACPGEALMTPWTVHVVTARFRPEGADHEDCPSCCGARHAVPDNQGGGNTGRLSCNPSDFAPRWLMLVVALDGWSQSARELA